MGSRISGVCNQAIKRSKLDLWDLNLKTHQFFQVSHVAPLFVLHSYKLVLLKEKGSMEGTKLRKPRITKTCLHCKGEFSGTESAIANRKFCSVKCRVSGLQGEAHPGYKRVERECANCGTPIVVAPGRVKYRLDQYCSKECGKAGRSKKISATLKPASHWRTLAKRKYGKVCAVCGFPHFIEVHHIVHRAKGGSDDVSNLIPLCPNHHGMAHAGMLSNKALREAQTAAENKQRHLAVTVWDQPA